MESSKRLTARPPQEKANTIGKLKRESPINHCCSCSHCGRAKLPRAYPICYPLVLLLLLIHLNSYHCAPTQTTLANLISDQPAQYPTTTAAAALTSPGQVAVARSTGKPQLANNGTNQQQIKSLKFTLIAGKFWKFNIKTSSFSSSSHKEGGTTSELRLHKNISLNNYIIDDDNWFQYNHSSQQLFAWPNLYTKPGTYQYVLIPSSVDIEADSENVIHPDVVANIIVELIRPLYQGSSGDIDQLVDYKFSLEYLHRHPGYILLLNQIVSLFESITSPSKSSSILTATTTTPPSSGSEARALKSKLSEILLINSSFTPEGDFFSLTWSTQQTLITNGTITQINECRIADISELVTKLSSISSSYLSDANQNTILYPLRATTAISPALVSTDRGSHLLKLTLNDQCQKPRVFEELGIIISPNKSITNIELDDIDNNKNFNDSINIVAPNLPQSTSSIQARSSSPLNASSDPQESGTAARTTTTTNSDANLSNEIIVSSNSNLSIITNSSSTNPQKEQASLQPTTIVGTSTDTSSNTPTTTTTPVTTTSNKTLNSVILESTTPVSSDLPVVAPDEPSIKVNTNTLRPPEDFSPVVVVHPPQQQQPTKIQPQAKSLANFLDDIQLSSNIDKKTTTPSLIDYSTMSNTSITTTDSPIVISTTIASLGALNITTGNESSLNEDFMGILNDAMDYLVSIAVPASIIIGAILIISILIALCHLSMKRRKSKEFELRNRFDFRYGSERRGFLKNSSKPVILEADRKSLSCGGTPTHQQQSKSKSADKSTNNNKNYLRMQVIATTACPL